MGGGCSNVYLGAADTTPTCNITITRLYDKDAAGTWQKWVMIPI